MDLVGRDFYQKTFLTTNDLIGTEIREPAFYDCYGFGDPCMKGDVILIEAEDGLQQEVGHIYLTTGLDTGTLDIGNTLWATLDRSPIVGETIQKVGKSKGWVEGEVTGSCVDSAINRGSPWFHEPWGDPNGTTTGAGIIFVCLMTADIDVMAGDSGGPIFKNRGSGRGDFLGITNIERITNPVSIAFTPYTTIQAGLGQYVRTRLE